MSGQRAAAQPYTTRFETEVAAVDGRTVWLETTYFYAESGGQPADRGRIGDVRVEDVRQVDGEHVHVLAEEPDVRPGQRVLCSIDWAFRMYCMRAHTASHVLYGAGRRLLDDLGYAGFDIGEERVRVDLETTTEVDGAAAGPIDDETLVDLDRLVNRAVWESRPVSWEQVPASDAREREAIAFNEATEETAFTKGQVRVVTIGSAEDNGNANGSTDPWDVAACGGTHVRNTREIGPVTVLGRSNPGEGVTRVELAVGPRAIDRRAAEKRATLAAKRELGAPVDDVPDAVTRFSHRRESLESDLHDARREAIALRLEGAEPIERDGSRRLVTAVGDVDRDALGDVVREHAADRDVDAVVAVGEGDGGNAYAVVASGGAADASASAIVDELTDAFGGGGGGSDRFAQAGGFEVSPAEVVARFD